MTSRAVFVQFTAKPSGSPISGLMVVDTLREAGYRVHAVFHQWGELVAEYEKRGCTVEQVPHAQWLAGGPWHRRVRRLACDLAAAQRFARRFREFRPRLVYVNNLTGLAPVLAAKWCGIPSVWHLRELFDDVGGEMHAPWPGGKPLVRRWVRRLPTHVVAISRAVAENVLGTYTLPNLTILPNAVGDEFFHCPLTRSQARQRFGLPQDVPLVGVPGTLRPVKGHPFFLNAFATVVGRMPQCLAAITGDGEPRYRGELERLIDTLNLRGKVLLLGTVNDMPAFYRACDVICIPSRAEPFGRTAVEAMAVGTPVVATAVGGLQETIQPGKTGWLVPFGDADRLANRLLALLDDREAGSLAAKDARKHAEGEYSDIAHRMRLIDVLGLVSAHAGRRFVTVRVTG